MGGLSEVWVTGIGIVSPLGIGFEENIQQLKSGVSPLNKLTGFNSIHNGLLTVGQIPFSNDELKDKLYISNILNYSRTTLLALIAAREALKGIDSNELMKNISLVSASTVGGMGNTESHFSDILKKVYTPDIDFIEEMDCGSIARSLIKELQIKDDFYTISTACSSSSNAIMMGSRFIQTSKKKMVLVGGSDSLSKFVINGFLCLKNVDPELCKPFDQDRVGLNLGEGSAFLLLEDSIHAINRNAIPYAKVSGYCNVNETYHMTGSSPEGTGAILAMKGALSNAYLNSTDIEFVHAHGTSTADNDLAESIAIKNVFGQQQLFASSKPFTGHTLAASGVISSVLSIGCMQQGFIFPNLNFNTPIENVGMLPNTRKIKGLDVNHIMINSFGFGGNNTSLIISRN